MRRMPLELDPPRHAVVIAAGALAMGLFVLAPLGCASDDAGAASGSPASGADASTSGGDATTEGGPSGSGCTALSCGLIHAYTFASANALADEVGAASATSVKVTEVVSGRTALRFTSAAQDLIELPPGMLGSRPTMTVCAWYQLTSGATAQGGVLFSWHSTGAPGGKLLVGDDRLEFKSTTSLGTATPENDAATLHLVCGVNGSSASIGLELYFDGQKLGDDPARPVVNGASDRVLIGADISGAQLSPTSYFEGAIDELYLWDRALGPAEVQALFDLQTTRFW